MSTMNASEIISVLKSEIEDFDRKSGVQETGTVVRVGDGIATVFGMQHAMYGELVEFETGVRGIVQNLETKTIGVVLLGSDYGITEGTSVVRTGKRAGIGVTQKMIGRVVGALGNPIDGGDPLTAEDYFPIEHEAPGVAYRKSVNVPLQTGILSIDSMFPIGRGQRELIIGDRQTGKTSIAVDTIINQKGQNVICIYVAIGQKSSTVAKIVSTLKKNDAMEYTIVMSASASEPAPVQYIAPYAGTAIAEYFMSQGKDVLIVYDDLSKHAVAYRAMSLLLHRPPGREAYPGDVFYLHSRLLERSCRLDDAHGGGSITALPIIETQASVQTIAGEDCIAHRPAFRGSSPESFFLFVENWDNLWKSDAICKMALELKDKGLIDGIGMQSHLDVGFPNVSTYKKALAKFVETGLDIQVTELDITTSDTSEAGFEKQAEMYKGIMDACVEYADSISAVVFWGTTDDKSWRAAKTPLLFNENYTAKPSFYAIVEGKDPVVTTETTAETTTTTTTTTTVTEPVGNVIRGDVNEDGMLNGFDLAIMRDMLFKEVALVPSETNPNFQRADMNADGSFNIQDAVTLMKFLLG